MVAILRGRERCVGSLSLPAAGAPTTTHIITRSIRWTGCPQPTYATRRAPLARTHANHTLRLKKTHAGTHAETQRDTHAHRDTHRETHTPARTVPRWWSQCGRTLRRGRWLACSDCEQSKARRKTNRRGWGGGGQPVGSVLNKATTLHEGRTTHPLTHHTLTPTQPSDHLLNTQSNAVTHTHAHKRTRKHNKTRTHQCAPTHATNARTSRRPAACQEAARRHAGAPPRGATTGQTGRPAARRRSHGRGTAPAAASQTVAQTRSRTHKHKARTKGQQKNVNQHASIMNTLWRTLPHIHSQKNAYTCWPQDATPCRAQHVAKAMLLSAIEASSHRAAPHCSESHHRVAWYVHCVASHALHHTLHGATTTDRLPDLDLVH